MTRTGNFLTPNGKGFSDIDEAWAEALHALDMAQIDITEVPVYLFLGQTAGPEEALFEASRIPLLVKQTPHRPDAPLHVYAHGEGIYITCPGTSLLARLAHHLKEGFLGQPSVLAKNQEMIELVLGRLKHLGNLIAHSRQPYCSMNGIVVLLPLAACTSAREVKQAAVLSRLDWQALRQVLQVDCPLYILVCDLEKSPGFREWVSNMPANQRDQALGLGFPLFPDLEPLEIPAMIAHGLDWFCQSELPSSLYRSFRVDGPEANNHNARLYQLMAWIQERRRHLTHFVTHGAQLEDGSHPILAGCYLAGTGADRNRDQAFIPEVFQKIAENQNYVSWTPEILAREKTYRWLVRFGLAGLGAIGIMLAALGYLWIKSMHT